MDKLAAFLTTLGLGLVLLGCEPEQKVDENDAAFESWLQGRGLAYTVPLRRKAGLTR